MLNWIRVEETRNGTVGRMRENGVLKFDYSLHPKKVCGLMIYDADA